VVSLPPKDEEFIAARSVLRDEVDRHFAPRPPEPSWKDIRAAALNDVVLHAAVYHAEHGGASREQALLVAALELSRLNRELSARPADSMAREAPDLSRREIDYASLAIGARKTPPEPPE
jgi:hypothetical protein